MKKTLIILMAFIAGCTSRTELDPVEQVVTDEPLNYLSHWHGDSGILGRFGEGSEIGAMFQYDFKFQDRKFVIFDETGKRFVHSKDGLLSGPHDVKDLFRITNVWGVFDRDSAISSQFAMDLSEHGVESIVFSTSSGGDSKATMTAVTKDGTHHVLFFRNPDNAEILNSDYGLTSHVDFQGALESILYDDRIGGFYPALISDYTGENFVDGDDNLKGGTKDIWPDIPSKKVEAMCYFEDQNIHTTLIVLGADGNITNGQFLYIVMTDSTETTMTRLVDLRK